MESLLPQAVPFAFAIQPVPGRGQGLVATRHIRQGTALFREAPFVWQRSVACALSCSSSADFCANCGVEHQSSSSSICSGGCGTAYCSENCLASDTTNSHQYLCHMYSSSKSSLQDGISNTLPDFLASSYISRQDALFTDHLGLAIKLLAAILSQCASFPHLSTEEVAKKTLASWGMDNQWTKCTIACRKGHLPEPISPASPFSHANSDEDRGDEAQQYDFVRRAMFAGHLRSELDSISDMFAACPFSVPADFRDTCLSEDFFDRICGLLLTNCQAVHIGSRKEDGVEREGEGDLRGVALYKVYCSMNHSCWPNISNVTLFTPGGGEEGRTSDVGSSERDFEVVGVNVFAAADIAEGEEIFNTYLSTSAADMSKKSRRKRLLQYLFQCGDSCRMCRDDERPDSDSDY